MILNFKKTIPVLTAFILSACLLFCAIPTFSYGLPNTENKNSEENDQIDPIELNKAENAVKEMRAISQKLELAYEDLNSATLKLEELNTKIEKLNAEIEENQTSLERAQINLNNWIKITYKDGPIRYLSVLMGSSNFEDFVSRIIYLDYINSNEKDILDNINYYKNQLEEEQAQLQDSYDQIKRYEDIKNNNASAIIDILAEQLQYFNSLDPKARQAVLSYDGIIGSGLNVLGISGITTSEGSHPEIAEFALNFLGTPYLWGGETPSGFDCSGFTMYVYQKVLGKSLTHFARSQFSEGIAVSKSALCAGDLVFFGSSIETIHHVGIYIGADKFIHAPQTGDVIRISTLSSRADYVGACRP
ncbi:MAG: NlpC/P60 family protein [Coriobacteriales bacterium]|nr:NlpC/P60 family protein [Coriobacteriales bacterium]